jgi:hypothetical protein
LPGHFLQPDEKRQIEGAPKSPVKSEGTDAAAQPLPSTPSARLCVAFWCK